MEHFTQNDEPFSLTVIVPNRNDAKYLRKCIESVVTQDVQPDEFIILDDVSTDDSVEVIRSAIQGYPFARLVCNPKNLGDGGVGNSNKGLNLGTSKFIYFLGANDFVLPGLFAEMKASLTKNPNAGLWSGMVWLVDEDDKYIRMHPSPVVSLSNRFFSAKECRHMMISIGSWLTGQTTVYRREALIEAGGFDASLKGLCDLLSAQVVASRYGAVFSPKPLAVMRIHKGALLVSTVTDPQLLESIQNRIGIRGPEVEPRLFTKKMLSRTRLRLYFASLRLSNGQTMGCIITKLVWWQRIALRFVFFIPKMFGAFRTAIFFLVMRPFDVLPAIWYRLIGSSIVLVRERLKRRIPQT